MTVKSQLSYPGRDLEAMDLAANYHRWILDIFRPFLGRNIVEVGAGSGGFSHLLLELSPASLTLVEPSAEMFPRLQGVMAGQTNTKLCNALFATVAATISPRPDSIVYINVLEHIQDDAGELKTVYNTLAPGGRAFIFVPALPRLFSRLDSQIGHFRRYTKKGLEAKVTAAGFAVQSSRYFDFLGIAPWWLKYRLLGSTRVEPGAVKLYDSLVVPLARPLETLIHPPVGKNILLIAQKPI